MSLFGNVLEEMNRNQYKTILSIQLPNEDMESVQEDKILSTKLSGHITGGNFVNINVYTNEGKNIPHFHIENDKGFSCCVRIYECNYFVHSWHQNTLNKKQAKEIDRLLRQRCKTESITVWQKIVQVWNGSSVNKVSDVLPDASEQPDYTQLGSMSLPKQEEDK